MNRKDRRVSASQQRKSKPHSHGHDYDRVFDTSSLCEHIRTQMIFEISQVSVIFGHPPVWASPFLMTWTTPAIRAEYTIRPEVNGAAFNYYTHETIAPSEADSEIKAALDTYIAERDALWEQWNRQYAEPTHSSPHVH